LFRNLNGAERAQVLIIGEIRTYRAEEVLFREGDPGDGMFIIMDGSVRISKHGATGEEALAVLEPNAFFGEMALIDFSARAADAIANGPTDCFFIPLVQLRDLIEAYPPIAIKILYALCEVLAQRLRETNERFMNVFTIAQWGSGTPLGLVPLP
jgi:CRP-like cAMP-binding protein